MRLLLRVTAGFLFMFLAGPALADDWKTTKSGKKTGKDERTQKQTDAKGPAQPPYTAADLEKLYTAGMVLRYGRLIETKGKKKRFIVMQEILRTGAKGYLIQTLTFNGKGHCVDKAPQPQALPYKVIPEMFSTAKRWSKDAKVRTGAGLMDAIQYSYKVTAAGLPSWRHVWYSKKYPGLMLKTMIQPTGKEGKKTSTSLALTALPEKLGGKKIEGSPQRHLPWKDTQIAKVWIPGTSASYETRVKQKGKPDRELVVEQTMISHSSYCFVLFQRVTEKASGKRVQEGGAKPQLWGNFLAQVRWAGPEELKAGDIETLKAAGKDWRCRRYTLTLGELKIDYYLALDVPGLTVRYVSAGPGGGVTRTLSSWRVGPPPK